MASPRGKLPSAGMVPGGSRGCNWVWCGRGNWRPPCPPLRPRRLPAARPARRPGPEQGRSLAPVACQGPQRGRLERRLRPLPACPAACLEPVPRAGRRGQRPGRRGRPPRPALVRGPVVRARLGPPGAGQLAARPGPRFSPAAPPPALRGFPPRILRRRGSRSGTSGGGGGSAEGSQRSRTAQLF